MRNISLEKLKELAQKNLLFDYFIEQVRSGKLTPFTTRNPLPYWEEESDILRDCPIRYSEIRDDLSSPYGTAYFNIKSILQSFDVVLGRLAYDELESGVRVSTVFLEGNILDKPFETLAYLDSHEKCIRQTTKKSALQVHREFVMENTSSRQVKKTALKKYVI
jgi:hypothetical protein